MLCPQRAQDTEQWLNNNHRGKLKEKNLEKDLLSSKKLSVPAQLSHSDWLRTGHLFFHYPGFQLSCHNI
jgi:hypothetical protein